MAPVTPVDVHPVPPGTQAGTLGGTQTHTSSPARLVQNATAHLFNARNSAGYTAEVLRGVTAVAAK
ncbi:MAG TPA: pyridoxal-dependent decarboxylase, partial [Arthrobacter sp.]|nr:pyridoxal-dependent decarboxylase [Arthrobacter sp.]